MPPPIASFRRGVTPTSASKIQANLSSAPASPDNVLYPFAGASGTNPGANSKSGRSKNSQQKAEQAVAVFATEYENLRKLIGADAGKDISADLANHAMLRSFLSVLLNAIPVAERVYLQSGSVNGAYALSTLLNNSIAIAKDITAKTSLEHQVNHILTEIILPAFKLLIHQQVINMNTLKSSLVKSPDAAINKSLENFACILNDIRDRIENQLKAYLLSS